VACCVRAGEHACLRVALAQDRERLTDVAGLLALCGRTSQAITIVDASASVLRLLALVGWTPIRRSRSSPAADS
jgi:hypothetical protein